MNFVGFGTGSIRIWLLIVSAAILVPIVLIVWAVSGCVGGSVGEVQENF